MKKVASRVSKKVVGSAVRKVGVLVASRDEKRVEKMVALTAVLKAEMKAEQKVE